MQKIGIAHYAPLTSESFNNDARNSVTPSLTKATCFTKFCAMESKTILVAKDTTVTGFLWLCNNPVTDNAADRRKPDPGQPVPVPELPTQGQIPCILTAREGQGAGVRIHGEVV